MKKRYQLIIYCAIAIVLILYGLVPYFEGQTKHRDSKHDWMANLSDDATLDTIYLPGTHDSCAYASDFPFVSRCQTLTIEDQLNSGFRYFDLRVDYKNNQLVMVHGPLTCRKGFLKETLTFEETLNAFETFIHQNPSETLLLNIKASDGANDAYASFMKDHIHHSTQQYLIENKLYPLKEVRGKIILASRYQEETDVTEPLIMMWSDQRNKLYQEPVFEEGTIANTPLYVQDHFQLKHEDKWNCFLEETTKDGIYLNFLSTKGPSKLGHPYNYAFSLNPLLLHLDLHELRPQIIIVDFGDARIAEHIYKTNFE